jgi:hypothetical protein
MKVLHLKKHLLDISNLILIDTLQNTLPYSFNSKKLILYQKKRNMLEIEQFLRLDPNNVRLDSKN